MVWEGISGMRRYGRRPAWWLVADRGVLRLYGLVESPAEHAALVTMARSVPGCLGVEDHLLLRAELIRRPVWPKRSSTMWNRSSLIRAAALLPWLA